MPRKLFLTKADDVAPHRAGLGSGLHGESSGRLGSCVVKVWASALFLALPMGEAAKC